MKDVHTHHQTAEDTGMQAATILIVEDSQGLNRLIQKRLSREGFSIFQAMTGAEALTTLQEQSIDLILLDYALPDMTARQIIEALAERGGSVPFVIMTGQGDEQVAVDMMKLGARDYVVKQGNFIEILPEVVKRIQREIVQERTYIRAEASHRELERQFRETLEQVQLVAVMLDVEGCITFCNEYLLNLTGWSHEEALGANWFQRFLPPDIRSQVQAVFLQTITAGSFPSRYENEILTKQGNRRVIRWSNIILRDAGGAIIGTNSLGEDITEQTRSQRCQELTAQVLALLNRTEDQPDLIRNILRLMQTFSGVEAIGIRIQEFPDYPYYETIGFEEDFLRDEQYLCVYDQGGNLVRNQADEPVIDCFCGHVLAGKTDPAQPHFTPGGSFWTNSTTEFLATATPEELRICTRKRCLETGYESVALIPLRSDTQIIGLLQLNDHRPNMFTGDLIAFFEKIGASIGIAIARKRIEEMLLQLRKAVETMHLGVTITDTNRKIIYTNPADAAMHGYIADELLGRDASMFAPSEIRRSMTLEEIESTRHWIRESVNVRKDGSRFPVQLSSDVVRDADGKAIALVTTCEDITDRKQAEKMLLQERNLLRTLIDNLPDHVFVQDTKGRFLLNNRAHLHSIGAETQDEVVGNTVFDYFPEELAAQYQAESLDILRTGQALINEEKLIAGPNTPKQWRLISKIPLKNDSGEVQGLIGIGRDITAQKEASEVLRASQKFLQSTIDALGSHIAILDEQGTILEVNASWRHFAEANGLAWRTYGIGENYLAVCDAASGESSEGAEMVARVIRDVIRQQQSDFYWEYACHSPEQKRWFAIRISRFQSDSTTRVVVAHDSITERKLAEEALKHTLNELEFRVRERTAELSTSNELLQQEIVERTRTEAELQQAKEQALAAQHAAEAAQQASEAASTAKSEFLANMSHDLRTPLNAILGYAQILREADDVPPRHHKALATIQQSGEHLLTLIKDILDLSKIEAGRLELQDDEIALPGFLATIADMIQVKAAQKGIAFASDFDPTLPTGIVADEKRLREVLLNLLGNAVKFTEQGTVRFTVRSVRFSEHEKSNESLTTNLRFEIEDTGIGISWSKLEEIFAPFQQSGEQRYRMEGTGLGLAISHRLVELMRGELQVESTLGQGSLFWFQIPVRVISGFTPPPPPPVALPIMGYRGPRRLLLIVDDQPTNREVLRSMLEPVGFTILEAENGQQGLEEYQQHAPDAILLDLFMPQIDGFEMMQRVRSLEQERHIVLIAISASASEDIRQQSMRAGCDEFLPKPFQRHALFDLLQRQVNLEWIYEEETEPGADGEGEPVCADRGMLRKIPLEDRQALLQQAVRGNVKALLTQLDQLEQRDVELLPTVRMLRELAEGFRVDQLVDLLEGLQEEHTL